MGWRDFRIAVPISTTLGGTTVDTRKLAKWFNGGIANKKIVFSGDSTTWNLENVFGNVAERLFRDGRRGRAQLLFPHLRDVTVYSRGENGGTLAAFVANSFTADHITEATPNYASATLSNLSTIIALAADLYVLSWGINDCRTGTTYTAANLQSDLTTAVNQIRSALPNACIILRMPNSHTTDNPSSLLSGGATAQNAMNRYQTAYRALRDTWSDVLVWDSQSGLFGNTAPPTVSVAKLLNATDGFHPSASGYEQILNAILKLTIPKVDYQTDVLYQEGTYSLPFSYDQTNGRVIWDQNVDPLILEGPDWYKVYKIQYSEGALNSFSRFVFQDYKGDASDTVRNHAWTSAVAGQGLVFGDVMSLENRSGQANTFVVNTDPSTQIAGSVLQWNVHPSGIPSHPLPASTYVGYVYRHKYANSDGMRRLMEIGGSALQYDKAARTQISYEVAARFFIQAAANGSITVQTIGSEPGDDLSLRAWNTTDILCIPGVTGNGTSELAAAHGLTLTGATFVADTTNKRMAITLAGVDFRNSFIPQGYVLTATGGQKTLKTPEQIFARKTADESVTSSITLQDDNELSFPIRAREEWTAAFILDAGAALATTGIQIAVTTPSGATQNIAASLDPDVLTALNTSYKRTTASGTAMNFTAATQVGTADSKICVNVWVLNGATAGDVKLQFAQSTSSATAITVRKGSSMLATRVA